jgi:NAD+ diphosphatase
MKKEYLKRKACWFIIQGSDSVLINRNDTFPDDLDVLSIQPLFLRRFYLGLSEEVEYYCAEIGEIKNHHDLFKVISLRQALLLMSIDDYTIGVKAYSVIHWDKNHQFCGRCGRKTTHDSKHFERSCPFCQISFFPRISPSIIVLIHNADHLIMARSPHFPPGVYGLIAGFVEVGETIEEAIHREVQEEVGLKIKNITYFGSQPWPFPDSLMLAFMAEYDSGDVTIDNHEIEDAGWYRYDQLPGRPSTSISIASILIDDFLRACSEKQVKF